MRTGVVRMQNPQGRDAPDIPFYQPTKFELVINRKAAKDTGRRGD
jgi:ABC-type uncharacterized transport system substrate-binding protein